ncbi:hypothetical protein D3OALGB2SA_2398 [Olavius algarvensis associated proteobacterium Delta 3]|nr:hypothetical protein D3OALGB2SA_2398 [Olavius algarvensis associated proteobacterium Delta 3]
MQQYGNDDRGEPLIVKGIGTQFWQSLYSTFGERYRICLFL